MTRKEIALLITLACINFTNIMDFMIMMPLQDFLEKSFHITTRQFGFLVSAYAFSAFASSMTASFIVDRFDRKHTIAVAFIGLIVGTFACGFATSYEMLLGSRIVAGIFGGLISAQALSIVGDTFSYEKRGRAMGLLMGGFALATIAGVPIGLYIAHKTNWQIPFLCIGILGVVIFTLSMFIIPNMKSHIKSKSERNAFAVYQAVAKDRNLQYALLMMLTLIFAHFATIPFIAPYLINNVGFTQEELPFMYFFGGLASMFSSPFIGKLADKKGKHKIFTIFLLISMIPVFLLTNLPRVPYYYVLVVTTAFFVMAGGRMVPAQALITSVVPPQLRGGFMNLNSSIQQFGLGLSSFVGGLILTKNPGGEMEHYNVVGYMSIAISFACLLISRKVKAIDKLPTPAEKV